MGHEFAVLLRVDRMLKVLPAHPNVVLFEELDVEIVASGVAGEVRAGPEMLADADQPTALRSGNIECGGSKNWRRQAEPTTEEFDAREIEIDQTLPGSQQQLFEFCHVTFEERRLRI